MPGGFVGVDIFFVISGFLITGILLKKATSDGRIGLAAFYAKRAKRILPAALLVLVVSGALTLIVLPRTRWDDVGLQTLGAAFSVVNWIFAATATDYLRSDSAPSPLQHYWTLSVEEQFYLLWPLLLVGAVILARRAKDVHATRISESRFRRKAFGAALLITVPSLGYSIFYTVHNPDAAYFVTTTRMWELGIGCILAIVLPWVPKLSPRVAVILGTAGIGAMLAAAAFYSADTRFPGSAALLPTLGAAAVILAGTDKRTVVTRALSIRPLQFIGDISYSLYLWHWPLIVIGTYLLGGLEFYQGVLIILLAIVPAFLSSHYVEQPVLRSRALTVDVRTLGLGMLGMVLTGVLAVTVLSATPGPHDQSASGSTSGGPEDRRIGAQILADDPSAGAPVESAAPFTPSAVAAPDDNPAPYADGCHQDAVEDSPVPCTYGAEDSSYEVALVGDSHAAQWAPALEELATKNDWKLTTYTKSSCPLVGTMIFLTGKDQSYESCGRWNEKVTSLLLRDQPDLVVLSSTTHRAVNGKPMGDAFARAWQPLSNAGLNLVVIADTPLPSQDIPECVSANEEDLISCTTSQKDAFANAWPEQRAALDQVEGVASVNLNELICPEDRCAPVIGNVLVYRDSSHLTATYSRSLAGALEQGLEHLGAPVAAP